MAPGMAPAEPFPRQLVTADQHQPEQVIETAAVDARYDDVTDLKQILQRDLPVGSAVPEIRTRPPVGSQVHSDLNVEVFRQESCQRRPIAGKLLGHFVFQPFLADRSAHVRVRHVEVGRILVGLPLDHRIRELVDHRKKFRVLDHAITHITRVIKLGLEDAGWRLIALCRERDDEPLRARHQTARCFAEHGVGVRPLAEHPKLINQDSAGLLA
ncbi:hypothetical protein D3C80_1303290 [compost metagenome]